MSSNLTPSASLRSSSFGWLTPAELEERRLPAEALAKAGDAATGSMVCPRTSLGSLTLLLTNLMFYVYLIQSEASPDRRYVGFTTDLRVRIKTHNAGGSVHTAKYRPWRLVSYHAFSEKRKAQEFEHYLKSASGRAFANKRFWQSGKRTQTSSAD